MGCNKYGQLGLGFEESTLKGVTLPTLIMDLKATKIKCGDNHSLALDGYGFAHGWGRLEYGAIGVRITVSNEPGKMKFPGLDSTAKIVDMSAGKNHSCFLASNGEAFSCGQNHRGQLGIGFISEKEFRTIVVRLRNNLERVAQVECGQNHTLYLTRSGRAFAAGCNQDGQLGLGHTSNVSWPERIELDCDGQEVFFRKISAGRNSSALDRKGHFYAWGMFKDMTLLRPLCPDSLSVQFIKII